MIRRSFLVITAVSTALLFVNFLLNLKVFRGQFSSRTINKYSIENPLELMNADFYPKVTNYELKDWHDYEFIKQEALRVGPGENGSGVILTDREEIAINRQLFNIEGLSALISDIISVNRSVPDVRNELCHQKLYLKNLPPVTIIVIFHNEHPSLIKRTLHSIVNRTPRELLNELILVNDASTKHELYGQLETYVERNFPPFIKIVNINTRVGLIKARLEGAKKATSEILVFLDSHIEVNTNWLPPLIEPVVLNPRACTVPIHDQIHWRDFAYTVVSSFGHRALFTWDFDFRVVKRTAYMVTSPKAQPVMLGCAFAINREYFWHLGGYDEELLIWNGENYELSLKLWLCGGELLEVPCSRVAHMFRVKNEFRKLENVDFEARNFKRVAEVWLGDHWKHFLYRTNQSRFDAVDPGDLTKQIEFKHRLNCKKFDYFIHYVAHEMTLLYSTPRDEDLAYGTLSVSNGNTTLCLSDSNAKQIACDLHLCEMSRITPQRSQYFHYSLQKGIQHDRTEMCLEKKRFKRFRNYEFKKNFWDYDFKTKQIRLSETNLCITFNSTRIKVRLSECNAADPNQKWTFGYVNETRVYD